MRAEALILHDSRILPTGRLRRFQDVLRFLGFCSCWHDLAVGMPGADPAGYAVVVVLHDGVESRWTGSFGARILSALAAGTGLVSFDHRFPPGAPWTESFQPTGRR